MTSTSIARASTSAPALVACRAITAAASGGSGAAHHRMPGLMMPAFSKAIAPSVVAELRLVIEGDRRDGGGDRRDDVGGVETAAEPDFEHRDVDTPRARKSSNAIAVAHSKNVGGAVKRACARRSRSTDVADVAAARRVRPGRPRAVDREPLFEALEMRRGVAAERWPAARSAASTIAVTDPLPLVPATRTVGRRARDGRARRTSVRMFSRPNLMPNARG